MFVRRLNFKQILAACEALQFGLFELIMIGLYSK